MEDLSLIQKQKCYDLRGRKNTFQIKISFNQATKQKNVNIVPAKTNLGIFHPQRSNLLEQPKSQRTANLPTLITTQDFEECGKVANHLKLHPTATDNEISVQTKLTPYRVSCLRAHLEQNGLSNSHPSTNTDSSSRISSSQPNNLPNNSRNYGLIKCPHCNSCVAKDCLDSHIQKQHPEQ